VPNCIAILFYGASGPVWIPSLLWEEDKQKGSKLYPGLKDLVINTTTKTWVWNGQSRSFGESLSSSRSGVIGVYALPEQLRIMERDRGQRLQHAS
jgi:hypothetical protein